MNYKKGALIMVVVLGVLAMANLAQAFSLNWLWGGRVAAPVASTSPNINTVTTKKTVVTLPKLCLGKNCSRLMRKFTSARDFADYLKLTQDQMAGRGMGGGPVEMMTQKAAAPMAADSVGNNTPRFSTTNVQVAGIDEPDILKTNGREIFFSPEMNYRFKCAQPEPFVATDQVRMMGIMPPCGGNSNNLRSTGVFSAQPAGTASLASQIADAGDLLLAGKILIVQSNNEVAGFDIGNPDKPRESWRSKLADSAPTYTRFVTSRLSGGKYYLLTASNLNRRLPCAYSLWSRGGRPEQVNCTDIYRPVNGSVGADQIYTLSRINPATGVVEKKVSFLAPGYNASIYMSERSLYAAYTVEIDQTGLTVKFIKTAARDLYPADIIARLNRLDTYTISRNAKSAELADILESYNQTLTDDERLTLTNNLSNRLDTYIKNHSAELASTEINRFDLASFDLTASGRVPGTLLNQFALDEYRGVLRVATTKQGDLWLPGGLSARGLSESGVYTLDNSLRLVGKLEGLGQTERIFGVRFLNDRAYLVTFRQIDPFYIVDLANPRAPRLAGELKIPGYSGYLHPLGQNQVIGVGMENNKVKLAIYDVSSASNPREVAKFLLNEYWSEAINNQRAFTIDEDYKVFFIPAGQGGYVFSYAGDSLTLKQSVSGYNVKRAVYIGDYLYVFAGDKAVIYNEKTWEKAGELTFDLGGNGGGPVIMY